MRQTDSAMRMLISAYKAVLANCYIKETLAGGGVKRFCKGVALSSFLTAVLAGVSSLSHAAELESPIVVDNKVTSTDQLSDYGLNSNNEIYGNLKISPEDQKEPAIEGENSSIEIHVKGDSEKGYNGDFALEAGEQAHGIISKLDEEKEINLSADGNLTIDVKGDNSEDHGDGINVTSENKGSIILNANQNIEINATSERGDGILLAKDSKGNITLTSQTGNNKIIAGNNGVDNYGAAIVKLSAEAGSNIIKGGSGPDTKDGEGDGLRIDEKANGGQIELTAKSNIVYAGDAGLNNSSKNEEAKLTLSASNGGNFILGQKEAVLLGCSGKISVTSRVDSEDINQDISLLAEVGEDGPYAGFNNVFVGVEESGIHASEDCDGSFEADAENNNYISGRVNGIWTEASEGEGPTINISAVNDNIIGFEETVANDAGIEFKGEIGEKGINVNSGSVTLTAGNENKISATKYGVYANGENTKVKFDAQANAFNILGAETGASGIFVSDGAEKTIISQDETTFNVTANNGDVNGIYSQNSYIDIDTDTLNMNISLNGGMNDDNVIGISADSIKLDKDLSVDIDAQNGINLDVNQLGNNTLSYSAIISGIYVKNGGKIDLLSNNNDINIKTLSLNNNVNGIYLYKDSEVILTSKNGSVNINAISANNTTGVSLNTNSKLTLSAAKDINIWAYSTQNDKAIKSYGIFSDGGTVNIDADNLIIAAIAENSARGIEINTQTSDPNAVNSIDLNQTLGVYAEGEVAKAISISGLSSSTIEADSGIFATAVGNGGNEVYAFSTSGTNSKLLSSEDINLILVNSGNNRYGDGLFAALFSDNQNEILQATTEVSAKNVNILAQGKAVLDSYSSSFGVYNTYYENNIASKGSNTLTIHADENISIYASADNSYSRGVYAEFSTTEFTANNISVSSYSNINNGYGIFAYHYADEWTNIDNATIVSLHSTMTNSVYGSTMGIRAQVTDYAIGDAKTEVTLVADNGNNNIGAGNVDNGGFGTGWAIYNYCGNSESYGSAVSLTAGRSNMISGSIYSEGKKSSITLTADTNYVASYAQGTTLGDLNTEEAFAGKSVVSALYAEQGAKIELNGEVNGIGTYAVNTDINTLERTVWAYNGYADDYSGERIGSEITINGNVQIKTDRYDETPTSLDVAVAAGTGVNLDKKQVSRYIAEGERAKVDINYSNISAGWLTDKNSNDNTSYNIEGDILSAYEGLINIHTDDADAGINIHGNLLAGNNGILNVDLGKNGVLTGRVDDYGDAGYVGDEGHSTEESFSDPAFSSNIYKGGVVNLAMGEGSRWNVTGQSWITRIEASDSAISATSPRIDLITANTDRNTNAHALTVYELKGNAVFNMSLDGNRNVSDMLYIKNAQGEYMVNVKDAVTVADMYANGHTGLRFATLGAGSSANFRAITWDNGVNNVEYEIDTDDYDTSTENTAYNGSELTAGKPGDTTVDTFFSSDGEPGSTTTGSGDENIDTQNLAAKAMTAKAAPENAGIETAAASDTPNTDATNYKLVAVKSSETSDAGKTVINMSRANYANAVYMDTLNKRQGEARFVSDTDHGVWVRLRHDNIGKEDAFRSHNTMVEVGIDQRDVHDYGEFHTGVALDYMNGSLDYHTVDGDGDIERYGIWFYTTYLGNDGQYADLILKYGHLKNDFGFNTKTQGEHVTGDYTNETASISAEYGWKFSNSHNYYIEPQAQLQYTYITGADYTTSQGSRIDLDSIHSLIGRVGFRAGKDFLDWEHPASFYLRADALHEFLGDQDIRAYDNTGVMDITYENDDTWYTVGLGMTVKSSDNTYFFIEGETALGADNEDTYTVSGGFRHSF